MSQQVFASRLSTASGYISEVEKGKTMPGSAFLFSLKREFPEVDMNWLITGERPGAVAETTPAYGMDPIVKKIVQTLEGSDEETRKDVLKYAEEKKLLSYLLAEQRKKR